MLIYILIAVLSILYFFYYLISKNNTYWKDRNVAALEPEFFFGNMRENTYRKKPVGQLIKEIYDKFPNEKVVGVYRLTNPALLIKDLDLVKHIMIKDFDNFIERGFEMHPKGLGANLFSAQKDIWMVLRNKFSPIFTSGKLKKMFYLMIERGDLFVEYLKKCCAKQKEQDALALVQKYTYTTISACAFGLDIDVEHDKMELVTMMNNTLFKNSYFGELQMMFPSILTLMKFNVFPKMIEDFFYNIVRDIVKERKGVPTNRHDFMDMILELKEQKEVVGSARGGASTLKVEINEDLMAAQAFLFYTAGFETSATTMGFMLYNLAMHQEIQDKVLAEIDEVLDRHNGIVTYENLKEMRYLSQAFEETLRLYPIVEPLQRRAGADYKLPGLDVTVTKGQVLLVSPAAIHRDPKYWEDPDKFDPDRFSVENAKDRHSCAYMPFGVGPRNCIGLRFAQVQSKVCIAKLLTHFRVEPSARTLIPMEFDPEKPIIGPKGGVYLNFISRNK